MMNRPRQRPRFLVEVSCRPDDVMDALRERVGGTVEQMEGSNPAVVGAFSRRHGVLKIPLDRRHFWSPELSLTIEPVDEAPDRTRVRGRFAPHPHIWTGFVFTYGTLFLIGLAGLVYALAQLALGRDPVALLVPLASLALSAFVYGAAFIGQGLGSEEIYQLRGTLDDCLQAAEARGRARPATSFDSARL